MTITNNGTGSFWKPFSGGSFKPTSRTAVLNECWTSKVSALMHGIHLSVTVLSYVDLAMIVLVFSKRSTFKLAQTRRDFILGIQKDLKEPKSKHRARQCVFICVWCPEVSHCCFSLSSFSDLIFSEDWLPLLVGIHYQWYATASGVCAYQL